LLPSQVPFSIGDVVSFISIPYKQNPFSKRSISRAFQADGFIPAAFYGASKIASHILSAAPSLFSK
jgi:hypothetical protein